MWNKIKVAVIIVLIVIVAVYLLQDILIWKNLYPLAHRDIVWESSNKYDVDPYLVLAIMKIESKFESDAVSNKGAKGLMQLMPQTANWIAGKNNIDLSEGDLFDPNVSIPFGTWYLNYLIHQFGSETIAIAAYNAGQGNVQRWIEQGIWDGTIENVESIPFNETRAYVMRVKVARWKYLDIYVE